MTHEELCNQIKEIADTAKRAGSYCTVDHVLPSIDVNGEYHFQEHEAEALLTQVPEGVNPEDFFIYSSINW